MPKEPYKCTLCKFETKRKDILAGHMLTHTGVKNYICSHCERAFTQRGSLTKHSRIHTGEKPYHCDKCGKRFSQSSTLNRHKQTHSDKKPYTCPHSPQRSFTDRSNLRRHIRQKHFHSSVTNLYPSKASIHLQNTPDGVVTAVTHTSIHGSNIVTTSYLSSSQGQARVQILDTPAVIKTTIEQSGPSGSNNPCSSSQSHEAAHYVASDGAISAETPEGKIVSHSIKLPGVETFFNELGFDFSANFNPCDYDPDL